MMHGQKTIKLKNVFMLSTRYKYYVVMKLEFP
jgi:hypothetical protein